MIKAYNMLTKIELSETANEELESLFAAICKYDTSTEISEVYLSMADTTNGKLNNEFCPILFMKNAYPSDELYENIKASCNLIPEYISKVEQIPTKAIVLWKREE